MEEIVVVKKKWRSRGVGFMFFASAKLGLLPPPQHYSPVGAEVGIRLGLAAVGVLQLVLMYQKFTKAPNQSHHNICI